MARRLNVSSYDSYTSQKPFEKTQTFGWEGISALTNCPEHHSRLVHEAILGLWCLATRVSEPSLIHFFFAVFFFFIFVYLLLFCMLYIIIVSLFLSTCTCICIFSPYIPLLSGCYIHSYIALVCCTAFSSLKIVAV